MLGLGGSPGVSLSPSRLKTNGFEHGCLTVFALFIAVKHLKPLQILVRLNMLQNRYMPLVHLIWVNNTMFNYQKPVSPLRRCVRIALLTQTHLVVRLHVYH